MNPTVFYAQALKDGLIARGIPVSGDAVDFDDIAAEMPSTERRVLVTTQSPPLRDMAIVLMKVSMNPEKNPLTVSGIRMRRKRVSQDAPCTTAASSNSLPTCSMDETPVREAKGKFLATQTSTSSAKLPYNAGSGPSGEANMAKMLAADASWAAADMCVQTHGGFGFAEDFDIERKFRENRLYQVAPISTNLVLSYLAEHVLGLPRSF